MLLIFSIIGVIELVA
jgi:hypothetical protein